MVRVVGVVPRDVGGALLAPPHVLQDDLSLKPQGQSFLPVPRCVLEQPEAQIGQRKIPNVVVREGHAATVRRFQQHGRLTRRSNAAESAGVKEVAPGTMPTMMISNQPVRIEWRTPVSDDELVELTRSHGGEPGVGWWDRIREHSLGWVTARTETGHLVGFVNVAWDGGDHAFLIDTKTRPAYQRHGLATAVVERAIAEAQAAGCEWLFVDFEPGLTTFYIDACGFRNTTAGLVHLPNWVARGG